MTSQENVTTKSHLYVCIFSQTSFKWNSQRCLSGTSQRYHSGTYPRRLISTSLQPLPYVTNETPNDVAVVRLHYALELRCRDVL